jgi:hypothetical protein
VLVVNTPVLVMFTMPEFVKFPALLIVPAFVSTPELRKFAPAVLLICPVLMIVPWLLIVPLFVKTAGSFGRDRLLIVPVLLMVPLLLNAVRGPSLPGPPLLMRVPALLIVPALTMIPKTGFTSVIVP